MKSITIYSLNSCFLSPYSQRFIHQILQFQPDIVTLQEFFTPPQRFRLQKIKPFYHRTPIKSDLITLVHHRLTQFSDFKFNKFKKQGKLFNLQVTGRLLGMGFSISHIISLKLYIINTHLTATYFGENYRDQAVHLSQITELNNFIQETSITDPQSSFIISGDLNFTPTSQAYHTIPWTDLTSQLGGSHNRPKDFRKLDYIFYWGKKLKSYQSQYLPQPKFYSDHKAIFTKITLE